MLNDKYKSYVTLCLDLRNSCNGHTAPCRVVTLLTSLFTGRAFHLYNLSRPDKFVWSVKSILIVFWHKWNCAWQIYHTGIFCILAYLPGCSEPYSVWCDKSILRNFALEIFFSFMKILLSPLMCMNFWLHTSCHMLSVFKNRSWSWHWRGGDWMTSLWFKNICRLHLVHLKHEAPACY